MRNALFDRGASDQQEELRGGPLQLSDPSTFPGVNRHADRVLVRYKVPFETLSGPVSPVVKSDTLLLKNFANGDEGRGPNTRSSSGNEIHSEQNDLEQTLSDIIGHLSQEGASSNSNPNGHTGNAPVIVREA